MINKDRLKNICADIGVELDAQALERFEIFASMLVEKNKVLNLTAITDPEGIAVKHFADSLTALRMIDLQPGTKVIDVGTGGGFPGIPLLIARPEIKLTMLDSTGKKLAFVSQSVEELGLSATKATTDDLMFTVETVSCLGACGLAPVLTVNDKVYPAMTPDKASELLKTLREA